MIFVVFDINLSSISLWSFRLNDISDVGLLFGQPRDIRSDEYNVSTLWNISQSLCGWNPISDVLSGGGVDTRLVYNCPSWSLVTIFRPMNWGYLLFGASRGLAWRGAMNAVFLFLASFELFRVFSRRDGSSFIFATIVASSPALIWWDYWDGVIYGSYLVVLFSFLIRKDCNSKPLILIIMTWLCGCYLMTLYPAWMIPFFYIYALMGFCIAMKVRKEGLFGVNRKIIYLIVILIAILVLLIAGIMYQSAAAFKATSGTVYPGARFETGGGYGSLLGSGGFSVLFAIEQPSILNACELAGFVSFFPLGIVSVSVASVKRRDSCYLPLIILQFFFVGFICLGYPNIIAKVSLFSMVPPFRCALPCAYLEVFLLVTSASYVSQLLSVNKMKDIVLLAISLLLSLFFVASYWILSQGYVNRLYAALLILMSFTVLCSILLSCKYDKFRLASICVLISLGVPALCIHPLQNGISPITDTLLAHSIQEIDASSPGAKWIVEDQGTLGLSNYVAAQGVKTLSTTQAYPNMQMWEDIDDSDSSSLIYNRYEHVTISMTNSSEADFSLLAPDHISVSLPFDKLGSLGVSYVITPIDYSCLSTGDVDLIPLCFADGYYIYEVVP